MTPTLFLINIIGGVSLLLYGLRLVRLGVTRGFGVSLRKVLERGTQNRVLSLCSGLVVTMLLQSSTATTMLISGFVGRGLITVVAGLAIVLGADIGTTLVAQLLVFDVSWVAPLSIAVGYFLHSSKSNTGRRKQLGRVFLGLGMMLLALSWIKMSAIPLKESDVLPLILRPLESDPLMGLFVAILLTWIVHSSLAVVLLLSSLFGAGLLPLPLAILMVLGANIGNVIAPMLAARGDHRDAQRIPVGNLLMRIVGVALVLPVLPMLIETLVSYVGESERAIVHFHTAFNVALTVLFLPFIGFIAPLTKSFVQEQEKDKDISHPLYLNEKDVDTPALALIGASRETLRLADMTEEMVKICMDAMVNNDRKALSTVKKMDDQIDNLYRTIKHYMARMAQISMTEKEGERHFQTLMFATNLEHIGDIVDRNLIPVVQKKIKNQKYFSKEGFEEISALFKMVLKSVKLAQSVYISGDVKLARKMVRDKSRIKKAEIKTNKAHMRRITDKVPETMDTSGMHMDLTRDLRRINSLITSVAYSILENEEENSDGKSK